MKNMSKLLISIIVVFIFGLVQNVDRNVGDIIMSGLSSVFLFLLLSLFFSWMFDTLYIKDYKHIYSVLDKKIKFNKYPNNKEKNGFRLSFIFIGFILLCTIPFNLIDGTYEDSSILGVLGSCFGVFLIYKLFMKFFFKD